jgi:hypothetical protein
MAEAPFSRRHGYSGQAQEITIWEDAPESLRSFVLSRAEDLGLSRTLLEISRVSFWKNGRTHATGVHTLFESTNDFVVLHFGRSYRWRIHIQG